MQRVYVSQILSTQKAESPGIVLSSTKQEGFFLKRALRAYYQSQKRSSYYCALYIWTPRLHSYIPYHIHLQINTYWLIYSVAVFLFGFFFFQTESHFVAQAGLQFIILLPLPPKGDIAGFLHQAQVIEITRILVGICSSLVLVCCNKHNNQKQLEENGVDLIFQVTVCNRGKLRQKLKAGSWRQEVKQKSWIIIDLLPLACLAPTFFYTAQALLHQLTIKTYPCRQSHRSIGWRKFFSWNLFS